MHIIYKSKMCSFDFRLEKYYDTTIKHSDQQKKKKKNREQIQNVNLQNILKDFSWLFYYYIMNMLNKLFFLKKVVQVTLYSFL